MEYIKYVRSNQDALNESTECACVYCLKMYDPKEITEWCSELNGKDSALCPYCGIDSVIPNKSVSYTIDDLKKWHYEGFERTINIIN